MPYTITQQKLMEIQDFMLKSVYELSCNGIEKKDIIIQMPPNHYDLLISFLERMMQPFSKLERDANLSFCGAEVHPIGYESKVVVYYKKVSYRSRDMIRTMDI